MTSSLHKGYYYPRVPPVVYYHSNSLNFVFEMRACGLFFEFFTFDFRFSGREIPKSPFKVKVQGFAGDPSRVTASGPGLEPNGVMVNRPTYFEIYSKGEK